MGKQNTAVEWFVEEMFKQGYFNDKPLTVKNIEHFVQQAKEMEKEQMCKFAYKCHNHYKVYGDFKIEEYYNKTFKSE